MIKWYHFEQLFLKLKVALIPNSVIFVQHAIFTLVTFHSCMKELSHFQSRLKSLSQKCCLKILQQSLINHHLTQ